MLKSALLVILLARRAVRSYERGGVPRGFGAAVEAVVLFDGGCYGARLPLIYTLKAGKRGTAR